jgi:hypothetical protein
MRVGKGADQDGEERKGREGRTMGARTKRGWMEKGGNGRKEGKNSLVGRKEGVY